MIIDFSSHALKFFRHHCPLWHRRATFRPANFGLIDYLLTLITSSFILMNWCFLSHSCLTVHRTDVIQEKLNMFPRSSDPCPIPSTTTTLRVSERRPTKQTSSIRTECIPRSIHRQGHAGIAGYIHHIGEPRSPDLIEIRKA